ncbi:hypothetical protein HK405_001399, partial [Cladochytrium tenue]
AQHGLEIYNGRAPWPHIYYLLRCGLRDEALHYAGNFSTELSGRPEARFFSYLREYVANQRLSPRTRQDILNDWNTHVRQGLAVDASGRPGGDPFKAALYKIIGRCEMSSKTIKSADVSPSVEDYLWLQLCLTQEDVRPDDPLQDRYTLRDMARNMMRFGAQHFGNGGRSPQSYFLVLMLCGEYERAVEYLSYAGGSGGDRPLLVEAVHFAIALASFGVLRVPESPQVADVGMDLLMVGQLDPSPHTLASPGSAPYEVAYLHFAGLVHGYVRQFYRTDPVDSLHYLLTIGLYGAELGPSDDEEDGDAIVSDSGAGSADARQRVGREYTRLALGYLRELLLDSGIAGKLVGEAPSVSVAGGDSGGLGLRSTGIMERLMPLVHIRGGREEFVRRVVRPAARDADRRGRLAEA